MEERMKVRFWDGTVKDAKDRSEAVTIIKEGLKQWMQEGDYIAWKWTDKQLGNPNLAQVFNELSEPTDAKAVIVEVSE